MNILLSSFALLSSFGVINTVAGTSYACELPTYLTARQFSIVSEGDIELGGHETYSGFAAGGDVTNMNNYQIMFYTKQGDYGLTSSTMHSYTGGQNKGGNLQCNGGCTFHENTPLSSAGVDFDHLRWLATHLTNYTDPNGNMVVVTDRTGEFGMFDFRPGGQAYDRGITLAVFTTDQKITLGPDEPGGVSWGPSVLAPFADVEIKGNAGFADGFVVAKSVTSINPNAKGLQYHGDSYKGQIQCDAGSDPEPECEYADDDSNVCPNGDPLVHVINASPDNDDVPDGEDIIYDVNTFWDETLDKPVVSFKVDNPFDFDVDMYVEYSEHIPEAEGVNEVCHRSIGKPSCDLDATTIYAKCVSNAHEPYTLLNVYFVSNDGDFPGATGSNAYRCCEQEAGTESYPLLKYTLAVNCQCPSDE